MTRGASMIGQAASFVIGLVRHSERFSKFSNGPLMERIRTTTEYVSGTDMTVPEAYATGVLYGLFAGMRFALGQGPDGDVDGSAIGDLREQIIIYQKAQAMSFAEKAAAWNPTFADDFALPPLPK